LCASQVKLLNDFCYSYTPIPTGLFWEMFYTSAHMYTMHYLYKKINSTKCLLQSRLVTSIKRCLVLFTYSNLITKSIHHSYFSLSLFQVLLWNSTETGQIKISPVQHALSQRWLKKQLKSHLHLNLR